MLASCPAPLVRDEYRLNILFLHLMHTKALMKRDDITTLATQLIAEDDIPTKGGWDIDEKTYEFTFHVVHTTGKVKEDERVLEARARLVGTVQAPRGQALEGGG